MVQDGRSSLLPPKNHQHSCAKFLIYRIVRVSLWTWTIFTGLTYSIIRASVAFIDHISACIASCTARWPEEVLRFIFESKHQTTYAFDIERFDLERSPEAVNVAVDQCVFLKFNRYAPWRSDANRWEPLQINILWFHRPVTRYQWQFWLNLKEGGNLKY